MKIKKNILIVDDSATIVDRLVSMLGNLDDVQSVARGGTYAEGIRLLDENRPHVAILDINLPGKSGIELLRYVKSNHPETLVIMLTNQGDAYYGYMCKKLGAHHFMDKSGGFERISTIISAMD
jgi:DNA-binding NarL/FixJ family response regulator